MVSDVDATVASMPKQQQKEASSSSTQQSSQAARPERQEQPRPSQKTYQAPAQPPGEANAGKWVLGIAAVIGFIWLFSQSDDNSSSRPTYSPAPSSTTVAPTPALQPSAAQSQAPSRPAEEKPSVGRNNVLSTAQIRYCLAEKIRLDAAESVVNNYVDSDVDRFNGYVNDYNSRCGEFRYRQGALESVRRDVEPYRSQLQAEGRSRFVRSPSAATRSQTLAQTPPPVRPSPDATIQAVQRRLNELDYDAGTADGLFGNKTQSAILAFQRDNGLIADGSVSAALLRQLEVIAQMDGRQNSNPTSQPPSTPSVQQSRAPANAWVSGSTWYCNNG
ncbi:Putative peptidoglycan binding domain-containing protein, partial [Pseudomonas borbori]